MKIGDLVLDNLLHLWKIKEVKFIEDKRRFVCTPISHSDELIHGYRIIETEFPDGMLKLFEPGDEEQAVDKWIAHENGHCQEGCVHCEIEDD